MKKTSLYLFGFLISFWSVTCFSQEINESEFDNNLTPREQLDRYFQENQNENEYAQIQSFDAEALNFDRFQNSPCYDKIGFNPTWDMNSLESQYSECESEYYTKKTLNIVYVVLFISILIIIVIFSIPKEKRKALIKNLPKP